MAGGITSGLSSHAVARTVANSAALKARVEQLALQAGDGKRAHLYGDLGPDARKAIDLRSEIARRDTLSQGMNRVLGRTELAQISLGRMGEMAQTLTVATERLRGGDPDAILAAATAARQAMAELGGLLNEEFEGVYLFSGSDTGNPAVVNGGDLSASGMSTQIKAAMTGLAGSGAAAALGATRAAALDDSAGSTPFSPFLASGQGSAEARPSVQLTEEARVGVGLWANRNTDSVSRGDDTTGSWARDLMRGLMTLAALPDAAGASGADVQAVVTSLRESFSSANAALGAERGSLGQTQARIESAQRRHADVGTALAQQLSGIEDVDLATTLVNLDDTRTRLEASYKALSVLSGLSLTNFLR